MVRGGVETFHYNSNCPFYTNVYLHSQLRPSKRIFTYFIHLLNLKKILQQRFPQQQKAIDLKQNSKIKFKFF